MPYMKYGDWYVPGCKIKFPTECEAMEYMCQCPQTGGSGQMLPPDFLNGELNNRTVWKDG